MPQACANCGGSIGDLEPRYQWGEHIVCTECCHRLSAQQPAAPTDPDHVDMSLSYATPTPRASRRSRPRVQTIEQTGKVWKAQQLISALTAIVGVIMLVAGSNAGQSGAATGALGVFALVLGLIWFTVARIGAWWCHG